MNQEQRSTVAEETAKPPGADAAAHRSEERPPKGKLFAALLIGLVVLAIIFLVGYLPRVKRDKAVNSAARKEQQELPVVNAIKVKRSPAVSQILLPGSITPLIEAPIYARATGYVIHRYVDIGDRVKQNELLATIDAPDLDQQVAQGRAALSQAKQQLSQAEASLVQSKAQLSLAKVTWDRYAALVTRGAVARQDADQQKSNYETADAVVRAQEANVRAAQDNVNAVQANFDRLQTLQSYKEVRSPFAGVVTIRNIDVGTYISTTGGFSGSTTYSDTTSLGSNSTPQNAEMFRVAQIGRLRILITVPQTDASGIRAGRNADVLLQEYPGRRFSGIVTRTSNSLDPSTRTLLTEVQVDNGKQELLPGMFAQVEFSNPRLNPPLLVPGESLIARADGMLIAVLVDPSGDKAKRENSAEDGGKQRNERAKQIHLKHVQVGRDYGTDTEIVSGLEGWETVVTNPNDAVYEGALVIPQRAKQPEAGNASSAVGTQGTGAGNSRPHQ